MDKKFSNEQLDEFSEHLNKVVHNGLNLLSHFVGVKNRGVSGKMLDAFFNGEFRTKQGIQSFLNEQGLLLKNEELFVKRMRDFSFLHTLNMGIKNLKKYYYLKQLPDKDLTNKQRKELLPDSLFSKKAKYIEEYLSRLCNNSFFSLNDKLMDEIKSLLEKYHEEAKSEDEKIKNSLIGIKDESAFNLAGDKWDAKKFQDLKDTIAVNVIAGTVKGVKASGMIDYIMATSVALGMLPYKIKKEGLALIKKREKESNKKITQARLDFMLDNLASCGIKSGSKDLPYFAVARVLAREAVKYILDESNSHLLNKNKDTLSPEDKQEYQRLLFLKTLPLNKEGGIDFNQFTQEQWNTWKNYVGLYAEKQEVRKYFDSLAGTKWKDAEYSKVVSAAKFIVPEAKTLKINADRTNKLGQMIEKLPNVAQAIKPANDGKGAMLLPPQVSNVLNQLIEGESLSKNEAKSFELMLLKIGLDRKQAIDISARAMKNHSLSVYERQMLFRDILRPRFKNNEAMLNRLDQKRMQVLIETILKQAYYMQLVQKWNEEALRRKKRLEEELQYAA